MARSGGEYPLLGKGDINLYSLFVERAAKLINARGMVGLLTPSGIAADKSAAEFFRSISTTGRLHSLVDFENKKIFFPDVHASFKFCVLAFGGADRHFAAADCAFYLHDVAELDDRDRRFQLAAEDFTEVNPNTGTAPIFRTRRDAEITTDIYRRLPVLMDRRSDPPKRAWPVTYKRMFDMTNDSHLFKRADELEADGFYRVNVNEWKKREASYLPLYEGKMVQMYDHRAASVEINPENLHRPAMARESTSEQKTDPSWRTEPQYWVESAVLARNREWALGFKDVTAPTNRRTMISSVLPAVGFGNSLPVLVLRGDVGLNNASMTAWYVANLNSFAFDFLARQKVQGQHLNWYIVEQIAVLSLESAAAEHVDLVAREVLRLSYCSYELCDFARALAHEGDPFPWDEEDRRHRMARLDALFFHLYGLDKNDADYILNTFPIVRADDEKEFGRFLTRDLILAYMNAVAAGDFETRVSV